MPATITYSVYLGQNLRSEVVISAVEFLSLGMEYYSATFNHKGMCTIPLKCHLSHCLPDIGLWPWSSPTSSSSREKDPLNSSLVLGELPGFPATNLFLELPVSLPSLQAPTESASSGLGSNSSLSC